MALQPIFGPLSARTRMPVCFTRRVKSAIVFSLMVDGLRGFGWRIFRHVAAGGDGEDAGVRFERGIRSEFLSLAVQRMPLGTSPSCRIRAPRAGMAGSGQLPVRRVLVGDAEHSKVFANRDAAAQSKSRRSRYQPPPAPPTATPTQIHVSGTRSARSCIFFSQRRNDGFRQTAYPCLRLNNPKSQPEENLPKVGDPRAGRGPFLIRLIGDRM
jgi:hypothetical protein